MSELKDAYYFMFEIGWFLDLLIPTLVRVKDGSLYLVGSKPCNIKDLKPCCIPCGGAEECKKLSFDDPSIKAFKCLESLTGIQNPENLEGELQKSLANSELRIAISTQRERCKRKRQLKELSMITKSCQQ